MPQVALRINKGMLDRLQTSSATNYKLNRIKLTTTAIAAARWTLTKTPPLFTITRMRKILYVDARNCSVARRVINNARSLVARRGGLALLLGFHSLLRASDLSACLIAARDESQPRNTGPCAFRRTFSVAPELPVRLSIAKLSSRNSQLEIFSDYYSFFRKEFNF